MGTFVCNEATLTVTTRFQCAWLRTFESLPLFWEACDNRGANMAVLLKIHGQKYKELLIEADMPHQPCNATVEWSLSERLTRLRLCAQSALAVVDLGTTGGLLCAGIRYVEWHCQRAR